MKMRMLSATAAIGALALSASGAPTSALADGNPTRYKDIDPNAGLLGIVHDTGLNIDGAGGKDLYSKHDDIGGGAIDSGGLTTITRGLGIYDTGGAGGFVQKPDDFLGTDSSKLTSIAAAGTDQNPDSNDSGAAPS